MSKKSVKPLEEKSSTQICMILSSQVLYTPMHSHVRIHLYAVVVDHDLTVFKRPLTSTTYQALRSKMLDGFQ